MQDHSKLARDILNLDRDIVKVHLISKNGGESLSRVVRPGIKDQVGYDKNVLSNRAAKTAILVSLCAELDGLSSPSEFIVMKRENRKRVLFVENDMIVNLITSKASDSARLTNLVREYLRAKVFVHRSKEKK